jgi:radical SAM superfamily enzyme YgiQ (UPF0313 family)
MKSITLVNVSQGFETGIMPVGLASLSAYLKKYSEVREIHIVDANCQDIYRDFKLADIVGVSAVTQDINRAIKFAHFVKTVANVPVILGGVHISTFRKLPPPFDLGVVGEGEETLREIMAMETWNTELARSIPGICYLEGEETRFSTPRELIYPLDNIPLPDRDSLNLSFYLTPRKIIPYHTGRSMTLMSSRGCPFRCVFCSTKVHWQRFRGFSAERVVEEMDLLVHHYGVEIIHLFDDLFIADKRRFAAIHDGVMKRGLNRKAKFMCLVRSDMLDDATMRMLKEMNVVITGIGMESGNDEVLAYLKQGTTTVADNCQAVELSMKYRIPTMGTFMIGNPFETEEQMMETLQFIRGYRRTPYFTPLSYIATTFPGTQFWTLAKERGLPVDDFERIAMDIPETMDPLYTAPLLTEVPLDRFFPILRMFAAETILGTQKQPPLDQ